MEAVETKLESFCCCNAANTKKNFWKKRVGIFFVCQLVIQKKILGKVKV